MCVLFVRIVIVDASLDLRGTKSLNQRQGDLERGRGCPPREIRGGKGLVTNKSTRGLWRSLEKSEMVTRQQRVDLEGGVLSTQRIFKGPKDPFFVELICVVEKQKCEEMKKKKK